MCMISVIWHHINLGKLLKWLNLFFWGGEGKTQWGFREHLAIAWPSWYTVQRQGMRPMPAVPAGPSVVECWLRCLRFVNIDTTRDSQWLNLLDDLYVYLSCWGYMFFYWVSRTKIKLKQLVFQGSTCKCWGVQAWIICLTLFLNHQQNVCSKRPRHEPVKWFSTSTGHNSFAHSANDQPFMWMTKI